MGMGLGLERKSNLAKENGEGFEKCGYCCLLGLFLHTCTLQG